MSTRKLIQEDLTNGNFKLSAHARLRLGERTVTHSDIMTCAKDAYSILQKADGKFEVYGLDSSNQDLLVVCVYDNGTVVITVIGD